MDNGERKKEIKRKKVRKDRKYYKNLGLRIKKKQS